MMFSNQVIILSSLTLIMASTSSGFCPRSLSSSSLTASASTTTRLNYLAPQDIADVSSIIKIKHDTITNAFSGIMSVTATVTTKITTDVEVQILSDSSHALMDFPSLFTGNSNNKNSTLQVISPLRMQYAQFVGRLLWISCGLVPNHGFHIEELIIQLVLLGVNIRPIIRSMILLQCINNSNDRSNCTEECKLELEDFLGTIETTDSNSEDI
jgi:hypothetical protein